MDDFEKHKCNGAILRSKSTWALESDRNTSYFLQLEKQRQNSHLIHSLTNIDGNTVTDTNDMLDVIHGFVKDLFSCVETNNIAMNNILECVNVAVDDDDDVEMCDEDITVDEICKSLSGMSKSKTPGPDGITAEFYLYFINDLQNIVHF